MRTLAEVDRPRRAKAGIHEREDAAGADHGEPEDQLWAFRLDQPRTWYLTAQVAAARIRTPTH
jgi:hypothetical protein